MWLITNTAFDRDKEMLRRTSPKYEPEPYFNGKRLRYKEKVTITDKHFELVKDQLEEWEKKGVVSLSQVKVDVVEKAETKTEEKKVEEKKPPIDVLGDEAKKLQEKMDADVQADINKAIAEAGEKPAASAAQAPAAPVVPAAKGELLKTEDKQKGQSKKKFI